MRPRRSTPRTRPLFWMRSWRGCERHAYGDFPRWRTSVRIQRGVGDDLDEVVAGRQQEARAGRRGCARIVGNIDEAGRREVESGRPTVVNPITAAGAIDRGFAIGGPGNLNAGGDARRATEAVASPVARRGDQDEGKRCPCPYPRIARTTRRFATRLKNQPRHARKYMRRSQANRPVHLPGGPNAAIQGAKERETADPPI